MIEKGIWDQRFNLNSSNWECECDKSWDVREYLDNNNYKCRKNFVDKLVEECCEKIHENKITNAGLVQYTSLYL